MLTKREQKRIAFVVNKKNPILEAKKYLKFLEENPNDSYTDAGKYFAVSRARITQMINLVNKLPKKVVDFVSKIKDPELLVYFTERRLRPLTQINNFDDINSNFKAMIAIIHQKKV